tara:strand:+ start:191 stop:802 length:612 start_codon:yes stop_codon:yes gene_type:complete
MSKTGFIYKITPHNCEEFYIGSTTDMKRRESYHIFASKTETTKLYIKICECGGFVMKILYEYECENEPELHMEEQRCIDILKPTLNSRRAFTSEECYIENKKQYYEKNRDGILEKQKIYKKKNRDGISEKKKIYNEKNRDGISENKKQYYEKNKDWISDKSKIRYQKNKDAIRDKVTQYYEKNKDVINAKRREQSKLKKQQQV